jgi:hypothetical protein
LLFPLGEGARGIEFVSSFETIIDNVNSWTWGSTLRFFHEPDGAWWWSVVATMDSNTNVTSFLWNVWIGTWGVDSSAILQVESTTKWFLPPRMTSAQRLAISNPAAWLLIYDTTLSWYYFYDGIQWVSLAWSGAGAESYHLEATKSSVRSTVPVDMTVINRLCKDVDGCTFVVWMKDRDNARPWAIASRWPYRLYMSQTSSWWRVSDTDAEGQDWNWSVEQIQQAYDCYFTDATYISWVTSDPSTPQLWLLNWNQTYTDPDMVCTLDVID